MSERRNVLTARGVSFGYRPGEPVLADVDFAAASGELVCILGPNGSGKTTLLRCLLGQLRPDRGDVLLEGRPVRRHSPRRLARLAAYVPQVAVSAFSFTVEEIVLMGRYAHLGAMGLTGRQDLAIARQAMAMTETQSFAPRTLEEISGGEAQRVMIARALAQQPSVMLLDEPTSHLDIKNQLRIYGMLGRVARDWPMAVVCVSHDINLAARFAQRLVILRGGRVLAAGPVEEVLREDVLSQAYDVPVELIPCQEQQVPIVRARQPR